MMQFYNQIQPVWVPDCDNDDDRIKTSFVVVGPMNEDQSTISETATADIDVVNLYFYSCFQ